jgi:hypothetical protein
MRSRHPEAAPCPDVSAMARDRRAVSIAGRPRPGSVASGDVAEAPAPVLLIDGNSLTYRAFFAAAHDLATASGQVDHAVFGFTSMLVNLLRDHGSEAGARRLRPSRADVPATSSSTPTRPTATPRPTSCASRWGWCARCSRAWHPHPRAPGFEADDILPRWPPRPCDHRPGRDRGDRRPRRVRPGGGPPRQGALQPARACPTTCSTTRRASRSAPASPPPCTASTRRCGAIRPTTCRACPGWGRRPRPS